LLLQECSNLFIFYKNSKYITKFVIIHFSYKSKFLIKKTNKYIYIYIYIYIYLLKWYKKMISTATQDNHAKNGWSGSGFVSGPKKKEKGTLYKIYRYSMLVVQCKQTNVHKHSVFSLVNTHSARRIFDKLAHSRACPSYTTSKNTHVL